MPYKLITVASLPTPAEAAIVRSRLDLEGIRSFLSGENLVVFCPFLFQFYSAYLLLLIALKGLPLSRTGSRHYHAAWAVNLVFILIPIGALGFLMTPASWFE